MMTVLKSPPIMIVHVEKCMEKVMEEYWFFCIWAIDACICYIVVVDCFIGDKIESFRVSYGAFVD